MKNKINWIILLQAVGVIAVVIGHSLPEDDLLNNPRSIIVLRNLVYSFHMPLFFFISGFLFQFSTSTHIKSSLSFIREKGQRLLVPYFLLGILLFIPRYVLNGFSGREVSFSMHSFLQSFLYPQQHVIRYYWFLPTLFLIFCMALFFAKNIRQKISFPLFSIVLILLNISRVVSIQFFGINTAIQYSIFFYLGCLFAVKKDVYLPKLQKLPVLIPIVPFFILFWVFWYGNISVAIVTYTADFLLSCLGILLILVSTLKISIPLQKFAIISRYSFQIFLLSIFPQVAIKILYLMHMLSYWPALLLMLSLGIIVPILLSLLGEKLPLTLRQVIGLK